MTLESEPAPALQLIHPRLHDQRSRIAVIGAGISGLACARTLADRGLTVTVFDKGRGPGGRMSTRRTDAGFSFDHGCQYFTARDERFIRHVDVWLQAGVVAIWDGRIAEFSGGAISQERENSLRYVGTPGMNAVCRHLAADLSVHSGVRVEDMKRHDGSWQLRDEAGRKLGEFDDVILAIPPAQAAGLLRDAPSLAAVAEAVPMSPCWAVMVAFESRIDIPVDGAFIRNSAISWIARNSSKPHRNTPADCWVLHGSPEWSQQHLEDSSESVGLQLLAAFFETIRVPVRTHIHLTAHRWRFAKSPEPLTDACLIDSGSRIAVCGDWCLGNRVEGAFMSGIAAADNMLTQSSGS